MSKRGELIASSVNEWLESDEGKSCLDAGILKSPDMRRFLENRLWYAFCAGANIRPDMELITSPGSIIEKPNE